jgi:flagellar biosynthesis protein FlgN
MSMDINSLRQMIVQDKAALEELRDCLVNERECLEKRNLDPMQTLIERKLQLIDQISQQVKFRAQVLSKLNLPQTAHGWSQFLNRHPLTKPLEIEWQAVVDCYEECQTLNQINGKLVARSQKTFGHILNLIRGQVAAPSLYGANGSSQTQTTGSYTLAKA